MPTTNPEPSIDRELKPKHPGGRPTIYSEQLLDKTKQYITDYEEHGDKIPSIAGLAIHLGISRETVYAWLQDKDKEEFSYIISVLSSQQERSLLNNGLDGTFNAHITKAILGKHGYNDNQPTNGGITINISRDGVQVSDNDTVIEHK